MKRYLISVVLAAATPLLAQQAPAPAPSASEKVVATVNGESITKAKVDQLWNRLSQRARQQYEKTGGGKAGFLDNYIRKRLMLQRAAKNGFEKKQDVQAELEAARESALFDLYVRDVIASEVVPEADLRKFYEENQDQMIRPERAHVRYLLVSTSNRPDSDALALVSETMSQLFAERRSITAAGGGPAEVGQAFSAAVRKVSDDPTAPNGGNLGWVTRDELESQLAETAFSMTAGTISGIIKTANGYVLLFVEGIRPAEKETFEQVRAGLREYLLAQKQAEVVAKVNEVTSGLYSSGKIEVFRDNLD